VAAVVGIIIVGWTMSDGGVAAMSAPAAEIVAGNFFLAVGAGLFAFGGWHMVTYTAEETIDPTRTIPRSLMIGVVVVTLCYIGLNAVYLRVLPIDAVIKSTRIAADAFEVLIGPGGAGLISGLVMFSAFGALNGLVLLGPRVYYQMAQDGLWFSWAGHLHPTFHTPGRAIVLQAVWSSVLVLTGTYRALFTRVIYTEWIFFALLALGVVLLRRRPGYAPAWRMPLVPLAPIVFVIVSAAIVFNQIRADLYDSAIGFLIVASGIPAYYLWASRSGSGRRAPGSENP
jgi:APA family basic amino acid/polyamine antiporter